jgi:hypothetical protein
MGVSKEQVSLIEDAYGLLWTITTSDRRIIEARAKLLELLDRDGQRRGIQKAVKRYQPDILDVIDVEYDV